MIKSLEGLRGFAALFVALFHLRIAMGYLPPIAHGYLFVDLFFVLSGFVIAGAYSGRLQTWTEVGSFMLRRFGRLFPLLVFATVAFVLGENLLLSLTATPGSATGYSWPSWSEVLSTATMMHALGLHDHLILNYASWSISTEFWAYVTFASVCLLLTGRVRTIAIAVIAAAGFGVAVWASAGPRHACLAVGKCLDVTYDFGFARCIFGFMLGALVWHVRGVGRGAERIVQISALVVIAVLFVIVGRLYAAAFLMPFAFAALVWSLARDTGPAAKWLSGKVGLLLGTRSYSVYLLHPVLLIGFDYARPHVHSTPGLLGMMAAYLAILLLLSGWVFRLVEAPARDYFNRLAKQLEADSSVQLAAKPER